MSDNVIQFPRRGGLHRADEYRARMRENLAAFVFIVLFLTGACWTIDVLLSIPSRPDCNFSVRRPCYVNLSPSIDTLRFGEF